jgi:putative transposase
MQVGAGASPVFVCEDDRRVYLQQVYEASRLDGCEIHAYALAPSRVQLLVTGHMPGAVARMMRRVGLAYARYANARDGRRGSCWRGRYLSCPVGGYRHIMLACGHVERSAGHPPGASHAHRSWSSHAHNAHGATDRLISPHPAYVALGDGPAERTRRYRELLAQSREIDGALAMHTRQGRAWGSEDFLQDVAAVFGVRQPARPPGRPRKILRSAHALPAFFLSPFLLTDWMPFVETL